MKQIKMDSIRTSFEVKTVLTVDYNTTKKMFSHVSTEFNLIPASNVNEDSFLDEDGLPNAFGADVVTNVLVQGLVGNIHTCHQLGYRDSAEHLRFIISELERGFVEVVKVSKSNFGE
jgi:hypothetical protein